MKFEISIKLSEYIVFKNNEINFRKTSKRIKK